MNPMGVSGFLDNQSIESATLVNEATARGQELLNQEKEYGLMSGMTQRGMAADVAGKEMETAYRKSLIDDIQYGLMDKRATETERRAAEKVKLLVESVTDKAFLEVVKANPGAANRAAYATLIGDKDIATAEKAHTMAAELGMNVAEAYKVSPAYAGQLLEQGTKRIKDVYGVDTAPMFGGVDFKSPEAGQMLQAWTAGHMDITKLIEHRFKLEEQTQKAGYDIGMKQFESGLDKELEELKAKAALERTKIIHDTKGGLTKSEERINNNIDAARKRISNEGIKTSKDLQIALTKEDKGRANPNYKPAIREWLDLAMQHKYGEDPEHDSKWGQFLTTKSEPINVDEIMQDPEKYEDFLRKMFAPDTE